MEKGPLTERAWRALRLAEQEARRQGRPVSSSHLLWGLLQERENLPDLHADLPAMERSLRRLWEEGPPEPGEVEGEPLPRRWWVAPTPLDRWLRRRRPPGEGWPFTPDAREALGNACREARAAERLFVGPDHLLRALARLREGRAARLLAHFRATFG